MLMYHRWFSFNKNAHMHTFQDKDAKMAFLQKAIDTLCKW